MSESLTKLALSLTVDDPEGTTPVVNAHCVLTELHFNYETQAVVAAFKCWRTVEAFTAGKKAFNVLQLSLPPKSGGSVLFAGGATGKALQILGENLVNLYKQQNNL
jgi:hypothetical protein